MSDFIQTTGSSPQSPPLPSLNSAQSKAIELLEGPVLILAGAGSGKTRVLTQRLAELVARGLASPQEVLAVTFTNKAAREMEQRILSLLSRLNVPVYTPLWISTFHSLCARILRQDIHLLDYQPFFAIYDDSDQLSMIKKVLVQLNINDKIYPAKSFQARINEAKRLGLSPEQLGQSRGIHLMDEKAVRVYSLYETEMRKANSLDFGDLLYKTHELFLTYPEILSKYQQQFRYIMVDEYQDTNHIQYLLVQMLAKEHRNLCVVGDEDQSIYSWRGADISNILSFEKDFPECHVIKLETNYRSTKTIVEASSQLISHNRQRKDKVLRTDNPTGDKIVLREEMNEYEEARFVVRSIEDLLKEGEYQHKDFAVFYRTNAQSRVLEDLLRSHSLPYKIVGGMKFYERMEIKDVLGYLKVILNPADEVSVKRIINTPARGIGKTTIEKIEQYSLENQTTFYESALAVAERRLVHSGACKKLVGFRNVMDQLRAESEGLKASEIYHLVLDRTEYVLRLKEENTPESLARIDNLEELDNALRQFEQERGEEASLQAFLEEIALISDVDRLQDEDNFVTLMTLHISKGLEFPVVFMVGMEEGLFPSARSYDPTDPDSLEEERRLCYVGMTRARERLFMTYARSRRVWGQEQNHPPSRFLEEIPKEYVLNSSSLRRPSFVDRFSSGGKTSSASSSRSFTEDENWNQGMPDYEDQSQEAGFQKGMRVRHPTFGVGSIYQVEGVGEMQKVSVMFADRTAKKFVAKYARLERV